jgi:hypothetical protein
MLVIFWWPGLNHVGLLKAPAFFTVIAGGRREKKQTLMHCFVASSRNMCGCGCFFFIVGVLGMLGDWSGGRLGVWT